MARPPLVEDTARRVVAVLSKDPRILGVAAGGSWLTSMDAFSDLDLVVVVDPDHERAVSAERVAIARTAWRTPPSSGSGTTPSPLR